MNELTPIPTAMLIDDESIDQKLYRRVMERSGLVGNVIGFVYPDEALEFLKQDDRPTIDVIFLDINMPRMSGFEFLEEAEKQLGPDFARMVVVMLTTSLAGQDLERARGFDVVKEYFNKPLSQHHIAETAEMLAQLKS
ncbi:MAG: response regulator [Pseudomonadota bacterium]